MALGETYREKVERLEREVEEGIPEGEVTRLKQSLDDVLPVVLLLLFFVVLFNFVKPVSSRMAVWITYANYLVILYFAARLLVEYRLSDSEERFFQDHILDFAMLIPAFSILEEVKLGRALQESEIVSGSVLQTGVAARMTKISRIIKKSL